MKNNKVEISNTTDPGIFKSDFEKNLYKKINEIKKYLFNIIMMKIMSNHCLF